MRTFTRKLLSLLLAFTMVCAMVPAALADDGSGVVTDPDEGTEQPTHTHTSDGEGWHSDENNHCQEF